MFYKYVTSLKLNVKHVKHWCKTSALNINKEHARMYVRKHITIYDNNKNNIRPPEGCEEETARSDRD